MKGEIKIHGEGPEKFVSAQIVKKHVNEKHDEVIERMEGVQKGIDEILRILTRPPWWKRMWLGIQGPRVRGRGNR